MLSSRYTIVIADRRTGVVRRFTVALRSILVVVATVVTLPILVGVGAAWVGATVEVDGMAVGGPAVGRPPSIVAVAATAVFEGGGRFSLRTASGVRIDRRYCVLRAPRPPR